MPSNMREVPVLITEIQGARQKNPSKRVPRYTISLVKEAGSVYVTAKALVSARLVFEVASDLFEGYDREAFYVICLDTKAKVIGINLVSLGTLSGSLVHPREVFKAAILLNASKIICAHNHPSGDPSPSAQDNELTLRIVAAGRLMGIFVLDHVICGEDNFFSYEEHGLISKYDESAKYSSPV